MLLGVTELHVGQCENCVGVERECSSQAKSLSNTQSYFKYTHIYLYLNHANSLTNIRAKKVAIFALYD